MPRTIHVAIRLGIRCFTIYKNIDFKGSLFIMASSMDELDLFDFSRAADFPPKNLENIPENDPLWAVHIGRRRDELYSEADKTTGIWHVRNAEYLTDTGAYIESFTASNRARSIAESTGDIHLLTRALLSHVGSEIATGASREARIHIEQVAQLSKGSDDPYVLGVYCYLQAVYSLYGDTSAPDTLQPTINVCKKASDYFAMCGEIDLAILARVEGANAMSRTGAYIPSIRAVEDAMNLATAHSAWKYVGRMLMMASASAADQGYRLRVEETVRRSIQWCQFTGDCWGRISAVFALGRLISFMIPSGDPSQMALPERYLRQAQEESALHGTVLLSAQIDAWMVWLRNKCGLIDRPFDLRPSRGDLAAPVEGDQEARISDLLSQSSDIVRTSDLRIAARLQDGVEDSPDAFFVFDARRKEDGKCADFLNEYRNAVGARILGVGPGTVVLYTEVRSNPLFADLSAGMLAAVERREAFDDIREVGQTEDRRWYRRRIVPSGDGAVLTLRDITAERQIEEALRHAAELAERSVRIQSEFLANMSHEIRTPINGVLGLARLLSDAPLDDLHRSYVEDIIGSGDVLMRIIGNVLDLSKIEANNFEIDLATVELGELIASTIRLYQGQAKEKGLRLSYSIDADVPCDVLADGTRIRQVLANLIGNAVKFTKAGYVEVIVSTDDVDVVIEVSDSGMGIPEERLEAIFDRFARGTADSRMLGGWGLGLAVSRAIVDLMGGSIRAHSTPGEGSQFVVRLPLQAVTRSAVPVKSDLPSDFSGRRVLLVDDNRVNTIVSERALARLGCEVTVAADGLEALAILDSASFDIIFMDVRMPVLDGLETTREIRKREQVLDRCTPVIALTAGALIQERESCFSAGMDDYVAKPFTHDNLRVILARWLS